MAKQLLTEEETYQKLLELINESEMHDADIAQMLGIMFLGYCHGINLPKRNVLKLIDKWWLHCIKAKKDFATH